MSWDTLKVEKGRPNFVTKHYQFWCIWKNKRKILIPYQVDDRSVGWQTFVCSQNQVGSKSILSLKVFRLFPSIFSNVGLEFRKTFPFLSVMTLKFYQLPTERWMSYAILLKPWVSVKNKLGQPQFCLMHLFRCNHSMLISMQQFRMKSW